MLMAGMLVITRDVPGIVSVQGLDAFVIPPKVLAVTGVITENSDVVVALKITDSMYDRGCLAGLSTDC